MNGASDEAAERRSDADLLEEVAPRRTDPAPRRRRRRRRRTGVVLLVCLALVGGAAFAAYGWVRPVIDDLRAPTDYAGAGTGEVQVRISQGDTGRVIGTTLEEADVVLTVDAFVDAFAASSQAASIQPGTYRLRSQMQASQALDLLLQPASRISLQVRTIEGLRVPQVLERITESTGLSAESLAAALADPASLGLPAEAGGDPEGYLFPATYTFEPDVTATEVLATMVARSGQAMNEVGVPVENRRDVLVRASIIQAEGGTPEDMRKISQVLLNRLAMGMRLQLDTTVNFATGKTGITTTPEDRANPSPYNTYAVAGLPPGPIDSPGEDALRAALDPEPGPWLFFVAVNPDTGETRFATTAEEHAVNVELFRQWLRENS